VVKIVKM